MNFSDNEIALARLLKKAGLEWKPLIGDWYFSERGVNIIKQPNWTGWASMETCVWLPLWHQGREILKKANIELTISDVPNRTNITLTLWIRYPGNGIEFYQQISADTDLEAMYQAIGKLHNERN